MIEGDPKQDIFGKINEQQRAEIIDLTRGYIMSSFAVESREKALAKLEEKDFMEEAFSAFEAFLESEIKMNIKDIAWSFFNLIEIEIGESAEKKKKGFPIPFKKPWMKHTL